MSTYLKSAKATVSSRIHAKVAEPKLKPTIVNDEPVSQTEAHESIFAALGLPSGKRVLVSLFSALFVGGCAGYLGTTLTMYLAVGCAVLTGSAFLTFMVMFMGYALSILATFVVTGKLQTFILSGDIDRCYQKCSDSVLNAFSSARNKFTTWSAA